MSDFIKAIATADVPVGTMKHVVVSGKNIAIANVDGEYFAVDDTCTHEHCSLGDEGFLDGGVITCGCHGAQYDATTGKVLALPAPMDLAPYVIKVEESDIYVKV